MKRTVLVLLYLAVATSLAVGQTKARSVSVASSTGRWVRPPVTAAPVSCPVDPVLSSDGTASGPDIIYPNGEAYYQINAKAGRSYAVEVWDPFDAPEASPVLEVTTDCSTPIDVTDVTQVDPDLNGGFAIRLSWIQSSDQTLYIHLKNPDIANLYTYQIRITDTTLFNPRWSTVNASKSYWSISNTTGADLTGTFRVYDTTGQPMLTMDNISIPAQGATLLNSRTVGLHYENAGSASFAFIGPADAVVADAYVEQNGRNPMIVPGVFVSKHAAK